jgi:deoxycytidine triphosphate deaminase
MQLIAQTTCFDNAPLGMFLLSEIPMARILSDREIKKLIGSVIIGADEKLLNPNGIELRLGNRIKFITTGEEREIPTGHYAKVIPGESVIISSLEKLDFSKKTVQKHFEGCMLMALITPTTTMIREGIMQAATKVDAGFVGNLNWGFRNSSVKDFKIQNGESLFKLTFFLLEGSEVPAVNYGDSLDHKYHNTEGILSSTRRLPVDIAENKIVCSSLEKQDPTKQLREAGHPFNYIGSELVKLHGNFELVSKGVDALTEKIDDTKNVLLDKVDTIFLKRFIWAVTIFAGIISVLYALLGFLQESKFTPNSIRVLAAVAGIGVPVGFWFFVFRKK